MIEVNPYPVHTNTYCAGYTKYLSNRQAGKIYKLNLWFFFFNIFWLFRHKQYGMLFALSLLITAFSLLMIETNPENHMMGLSTMTVAYYAFSCITYHMYHLKCLNNIDYSLPNPLEKMKPIPYVFVIPGAFIFFGISLFFVTYFQYYTMIFVQSLM